MHHDPTGTTTSARDVIGDDLIPILDPNAVDEGRLAVHKRSPIGAFTEESGDVEADQMVTYEMLVAHLTVAMEARVRILDDLAVIHGKILGLREILDATAPAPRT